MAKGEHIYLVQPDPRARAACFHMLTVHPNRVVRGFAEAADFVAQIDELEGGCVLLDWLQPGATGVADLLGAIARRADMVSFVIAAQLSLGDVRTLLRAGARDLFTPPLDPAALLPSIETGLAGLQQRQQSQSECAAASQRLGRLTDRERAILASLAEGLSSKAVARRFDLSPRTVEVHRANILRRAEAASLAELLRLQILSEQHVLAFPLMSGADPSGVTILQQARP